MIAVSTAPSYLFGHDTFKKKYQQIHTLIGWGWGWYLVATDVAVDVPLWPDRQAGDVARPLATLTREALLVVNPLLDVHLFSLKRSSMPHYQRAMSWAIES